MKRMIKLLPALGLLMFSLIIAVSCNKVYDELHDVFDKKPVLSKPANKYSSDVVVKWLDLKYRIFLQPQVLQRPGTQSFVVRFYGYLGVALYESAVPGMPSHQSLSGQLTDMPQMPKPEKGKLYHWPASANAALAFVHKSFLPNTSAANKLALDSLEGALNAQYQTEADAATIQRSADFGRAVAKLIVDWSETDGTFAIWPPYVRPVGPGLWVPTPPNFNEPTGGIYRFGDHRTFVPGVLNEASPPLPPAYSTDPSSDFYKMEKEVYDVSQTLTSEQNAQASYWAGTTGGTPAIHWFAILKKVLVEQSAKLDIAALAYCQMGLAQYDAAIVAAKVKYTYNLLRPATYIRDVLGHTTWLPSGPGNPNPDWPDSQVPDHSSSAGVLSSVFGKNYHFNTEGTHVNPARYQGYTFHSFEEAAVHGGTSRFLLGYTTKPAVDAGLSIGFKTVNYMNNKIKFKKGG
ncbi:MAG: hypothetical protein WKF91_22545 [Segetibacter sp.]